MVNPILAGSIALMISTGAGVLVAPRATAYLDAEAGGWCGEDADVRAHAKSRHAEAEGRASARAARWLCGDADGHGPKPHDEAGDGEECEEHGTAHRARVEARPRVEARVDVDVRL